jgi:hypothetical protein
MKYQTKFLKIIKKEKCQTLNGDYGWLGPSIKKRPHNRLPIKKNRKAESEKRGEKAF